MINIIAMKIIKSDTKYRDIADGNKASDSGHRQRLAESDTKYRDIADGNTPLRRSASWHRSVRYQVPRYSGWKLPAAPLVGIKDRSQIPSTAI